MLHAHPGRCFGPPFFRARRLLVGTDVGAVDEGHAKRDTTPLGYVEHVLAPEREPGDAVVMDNLSVHKVAGVREAIRAAGASVLYLPSYSPDFNPIEQLFAKFKSLLRKAAARTQTALWETIGIMLDDFTPGECQNYIANSGYEFV